MVSKIYITCLIILAILCWSCKKKKQQEASEEKSATEVSLSSRQVKVNNIRLGSPEMKSMSAEIIANGNVDVPPQFRAAVSIAVGGFVKSTEVLEGDHVHKGEVLCVLSHPDYVLIQQQYLEALSREILLKKELERQEYLREENVNAKKDLERTQAEMKINNAQLKAAEARLHILGLSPESVAKGNISPNIYVRAPFDGDVTVVNTTLGKFIKPEETIFEVISKEHLHLDLQVYEQDVLKVKAGQKVLYFLGNNDEMERTAKVFLVGKKLDLNSRTVSIHAHPEGKSEGMLPGMYVKARILADPRNTPAIPTDAVVREGDNTFVFALKSKSGERELFEKIPVTLGTIQNDFVEVKLPGGDWGGKIVVEGAYYLAAEMKKGDDEEE